LIFLAEIAATMAAAVVPWRPGPGAEEYNIIIIIIIYFTTIKA
jgi:hypothetical protein